MALQVLGKDRLLDPAQIELFKHANAANSFRGRQALVVVNHQRNVGADDDAHAAHHVNILCRVGVTHFNFDGAKALR